METILQKQLIDIENCFIIIEEDMLFFNNRNVPVSLPSFYYYFEVKI